MRALRPSKPRPLSVSLARFSSVLALSAAICGAARGATVYYDADQTAAGNSTSGAGLGVSATPAQNIWDTSTLNWWNGTADTAWTNGTNTAVFGGTAGAVTLNAPLTVGSLIFQTNGYSLSGNTITLGSSGSQNIINFNERTGATVNTTIQSLASANGLTLNGNGGTLTLSGDQNGLTGTLSVRSGTLKVGNAANFQLGSSVNLSFDGNGKFLYDNAGATGSAGFNQFGPVIANGEGVVQINRTFNNPVTGIVTLEFANFTRNAGGSVLFTSTANSADSESNSKFMIDGLEGNSGFAAGAFVKYGTAVTSLGYYDSASHSFRPLTAGNFGSIAQTTFANGKHIVTATAQTATSAANNFLSLTLTAGITVGATNTTLTINSGTGVGVILKTGGNAATFSASGTGALTVGGAGELLIRTDAAADQLTITAPITNTTGALTKSGDGTLVLSSASNAFTGPTYINAGTLRISGTGAKGTGTGTTNGVFLNGGTYEMVTLNDTAINTGKDLTVNGSGTINWTRSGTQLATNQILSFGALSIGNQVLTASPLVNTWGIAVTGATTLRDTLPATFNVTGTQASNVTPGLNLSGAVSGTSGLIKRGSGTLALTGSNSFGGAGAVIEIQGGLLIANTANSLGNPANTLMLNTLTASEGLVATGTFAAPQSMILAQPTNSIEVTAGNTLTWQGVISSPGVANLTKLGAGTLTLAGANTFGGTGGTLDVQNGSLQVTNSSALGAVTNKVNLNTAGTFSSTATATLGQAFTLQGATNTVDVGSGLILTLNGTISNTTATAVGLTKTGAGTLVLANSGNTFGGVGKLLDIQAGTLSVASGGALGDFNNEVRLTSGSFNATGTSSAYQAFNFNTATAATLDVSGSNTFSIRGLVSGPNLNTLTKNGSGTLELTGAANTMGVSGNYAITVNDGFLAATSNGALGTTTGNNIFLNNAPQGGNPANVSGFLATGTFDATGRVFNLAANRDLTFRVIQGSTLGVNTAFVGTGNVIKDGVGRLTLSASQAWTGTMTVADGTLRIANSDALGATSGITTIKGNGGLELGGGSGNVTTSEPITLVTTDGATMAGSSNGGVIRVVPTSGNGNLTGTVSGPITVTTAATTGTRTIAFGVDVGSTLKLAGTGSSNAIAFNTLAGSTTTILLGGEAGSNGEISKTITNAGSGTINMIKSGTGTWLLQPTVAPALNDIQLRAGRVTLAAATGNIGVLGTSTSVTFNGGGTFAYDTTGIGVSTSQSLGALAFNSGDGTVSIVRSSVNTGLNFTSLTRATGAVGFFSATAGNLSGGSINEGFAINALTSSAIPGFINSGIFVQDATGTPSTTAFGWYDTSTSTVRKIAYGSDANAFSVSAAAGALSAGGGNRHLRVVSAGAQSTLTSSTSLYSLELQSTATSTVDLGGNSLVISNTATVAGGGSGNGSGAILKTGGTSVTIGGAAGSTISSGGTLNELIIRTDTASDALVINTNIVNTGALTKSGAGALTLSGSNSWSGATYVNGGSLVIQGSQALSGSNSLTLNTGTFSFQDDGDNRSSLQDIYVGGSAGTVKNLVIAGGNSAITVGRFNASGSALNKTIKFGSMSIGNQTLTINPGSNGYGVDITGTVALSSSLPTTFNVGSTQASDVVPGLTLSGQITSTSAAKSLIKTGTGTLALTNTSAVTPNTFGGEAGVIDIQGGIVSVNADSSLGNVLNQVNLNVAGNTLQNQGFRANGTFSSARTFVLNQADNDIEVTQGNMMTLTTGLSIPSAANTLYKKDNGVLFLAADSPAGWTGAINIAAGGLRIRTTGGLGSTLGTHAITVSANAALQLAGTNTTYGAYAVSLANSGLNNGGALENVSGSNTWTGNLTMTGATTIGSTSGTLTLTGQLLGAQALTLAGDGNINLSNNGGLSATLASLTKTGNGTTTLTTNSAGFVGNLTLSGGTFTVRGSGVALGGTGAITITPGATLRVDDSVGAASSHLGGRAITIGAGTFRYDGNTAANSAETFGALTINSGQTTIISEPGLGKTSTITFGSLTVNADTSLAFNGTSIGQPSNRVLFTTAPSLTNLMIPRASVNEDDFATYIPDQTLSVLTSPGQNSAILQGGATTRQLVVGQIINADGSNNALPVGAIITSIPTTTTFTFTGVTGGGTNQTTNTKFAATGIAAMNPSAYQDAQDISTAGVLSTDTFLFSSHSTVNSIPVNKSIGSLKMIDGLSLGGAPRTVLTLTSGGILSTGGDNSLVVPILALGGVQGITHVKTGTTMTITSTITGTAGFVKADGGRLILDPGSSAITGVSDNTALTGTHDINGGILQLGATAGTPGSDLGNNVLSPGVAVRMSPGATLDTYGHLQLVGPLLTDSTVSGAAGALGNVTSNSGAGSIVVNQDDTPRNWAGSITDGTGGTMSWSRSGRNSLTVYSPQTYSGVTQINGGTTTILRDAGALTSTSAIDLNYSFLTLENKAANGSLAENNNRINDAAPINLRTSTLTFNGREQSTSTETLGAVTLKEGLSLIVPVAGGTGINSATLTLASLTQQAGSAAVVNFNASLGQIGSNAARVVISSAPTLSSNIIGPWAIVNGADFATYNAGLGVGALGATGFANYEFPLNNTTFAGYSGTQSASANVKVTGFTGTTTFGTNLVANTLNLAATGTATVGMGGTQILNLTGGGLLKSGNVQVNIGSTANNGGLLTAGGTANTGTTDLYVYNHQSALVINSHVVDTVNSLGTATGGKVRLIVTNGSGATTTLAASNTQTGGTVVNGGTVLLTGLVGNNVTVPKANNVQQGLVINGATVTMQNQAQQIAAENVVTLNGSSALNFFGDNSIAGLVFNNSGGIALTPTVNTFTAGAAANGAGTLFLGANGITATSSNITTAPIVNGRIDLSAETPFNIGPILFNGKSINPNQATLSVQSIGSVNGNGGIRKTGDGVLQINTQSTYLGDTFVDVGGLQFGGTTANPGSRFSAVTVASGARINLNGVSTVIGSLSGGGMVTNSSTTGATLTMGFDNKDTVFSGQFRRIDDGVLTGVNITKIGTGKMEITGGGSDAAGTLSVQGGEVLYRASGASQFGTNTVLTRGTLSLDNTASDVQNRLGGSLVLGQLNMNGGTLNLRANNSVAMNETVATFIANSGSSVIHFEPGSSSIQVRVGTTFNGIATGGTVLFQGISGSATINLQGLSFGAPAGTGTGVTATQQPIRPDMIGDSTPGGTGTSFITNGSSSTLRLLDPSTEVLNFLSPGTTISNPDNYDLFTPQTVSESNSVASLVLRPGAGITNTLTSLTYGGFGPNGTRVTQTVASGGILAVSGGNSSITVPLVSTANNLALIFHTAGTADLTINGDVTSGTSGLTKSGAGKLTLNSREYYTGTTTINEGTVVLNSQQENGVAVTYATSTNFAVNNASPLTLNGGTLDLGGQSQVFGTLSSNNPNALQGGTIMNTGGAVVLTSAGTAGSNFNGQITGNNVGFTLMRSSAPTLPTTTNNNTTPTAVAATVSVNTLTMFSPQTYTGPTVIRGGVLSLRDQGSLASTAIEIDYGQLTIDQTGLTPSGNLNYTRLSNTTNFVMQGGIISNAIGGAMNGDTDLSGTVTTPSTMTIQGGANQITNGWGANVGSSSILRLGNIVRAAGTTGIVNFTANGGTLGVIGLASNDSVNPRTYVKQVNGVQTSSAVTNGILGPWAIVGGVDFATVNSVGGDFNIGALSQTGFTPYATAFVDSPNSNVRISATTTMTSNITLNTLAMTGNTDLVQTGGPWTLNLQAGGIIRNGSSAAENTIGGALNSGNEGFITSGGTSATPPASGLYDLYIHNSVNTLTINSQIVDNGASNTPVRLILNGGGTIQLTNNNTYTGGTVINSGTVALKSANVNGFDAPIPGDVTINNGATLTYVNSPNQLTSFATVTLDGGATFNVFGSGNQLSKIAFNGRGGNAIPVVTTTPTTPPLAPALASAVLASLTLNGSDAISSINDTLASTPSIRDLYLQFSDGNPTITTNGAAPIGLQITAFIRDPNATPNGPIFKSGSTGLYLNPSTVMISSSTTVNSVGTVTVPDTSNLQVGMGVSGSGIVAGTVISAVVNATTIQLSVLPSSAQTNVNLIYSGDFFTQGVSVNDGTLVLGSSSNILNGNFVSGPIGVGPLTMGMGTNGIGTALVSDNTIRTINNPVTVLGNMTFGTLAGSTATAVAGSGVILAGDVAFTPGSHAIEVNSVVNTSTIRGQIKPTEQGFALTKTGPGTLVLSNSNNAAPTDFGSGVVAPIWNIQVQGGVLKNGATGAIPDGSNLNVSAGAVFDSAMPEQVINSLTGAGVITNSGSLTTSAGTLYVGGLSKTDTTTVTDSVFSGSISGISDATYPLSVTKVGAGTLTLTGANTFKGSLFVGSGRVNFPLGSQFTANNDLSVQNNATVRIDGTIAGTPSAKILVGQDGALTTSATLISSGDIQVRTTISQGGVLQSAKLSGHQMTMNESRLQLDPFSTVVFSPTAQASTTGDLNAGSAIIFTQGATLDIDSDWTLKLQVGDLVNPVASGKYVIFDGDVSAFDFLNFNDGNNNNVGSYTVDFSATPGWHWSTGNHGLFFDVNTNNIYITGIAVPEPGAVPMLLGSLGVALGLQRFRKRRN